MMKVLVDAELFLEFFLNRNQYEKDACRLLKMAESGQIELYITELCIDKICLEDKRRGIPDEEGIARVLEEKFRNHLIPYNNCLIREQVFKSIGNTRDFECAVETACAIAMNIGAVVTHKPEDFYSADLLVWTVNDLLKGLNDLPVLTETEMIFWVLVLTETEIDFLKFKLELSYKQDGLALEHGITYNNVSSSSPPGPYANPVVGGRGFGNPAAEPRKEKTSDKNKNKQENIRNNKNGFPNIPFNPMVTPKIPKAAADTA